VSVFTNSDRKVCRRIDSRTTCVAVKVLWDNEQVAGTLLIISALLELRDLRKFEFDGCFTAEDVNQHLDLELIFVELDDFAAEVGEGTFLDSNRFAHFVELSGASRRS
jgi:hypothetical protein